MEIHFHLLILCGHSFFFKYNIETGLPEAMGLVGRKKALECFAQKSKFFSNTALGRFWGPGPCRQQRWHCSDPMKMGFSPFLTEKSKSHTSARVTVPGPQISSSICL